MNDVLYVLILYLICGVVGFLIGFIGNLIYLKIEGRRRKNEIIDNLNLFLSRRTYWTNHSRN